MPTIPDVSPLPMPWAWLARRIARFALSNEPATAETTPPARLVSQDMLRELERHRLAGLLPQLLDGVPLPDEWTARIREHRLAAAAHYLRLMRRAQSLARLAERCGNVRLLFIKGLPLATHHYEKASMRPTSDVDVVVESHAAPALLEALQSAGWRSPYAGQPRRWREELAENAKHYELRFAPDDSRCGVEIHVGRYVPFARWNWDDVWREAADWLVEWPEMGPRCYRLRPELDFLFLPLHALSDGLVRPFELLCDTAVVAKDADPDRVLQAARRFHLCGLAAVQTRLLGKCLAEIQSAGGARPPDALPDALCDASLPPHQNIETRNERPEWGRGLSAPTAVANDNALGRGAEAPPTFNSDTPHRSPLSAKLHAPDAPAWRGLAEQCWRHAGWGERRLARLFARYYWRALPHQPQPSWLSLTWLGASAAALRVPVRVAERVLGITRDQPGFQRRRLAHLLTRWRRFWRRTARLQDH